MTESVHHSPMLYRLMTAEFGIRDFLHPPERVLSAAGLRPGMTVLDFGCGPGGFAVAAARMAGPAGRVYAVDIHPLALESVRRRARKHTLGTLRVLHGDDLAEIGEGTVDLALLYDVLHEIDGPEAVLARLRRILKGTGALSVRDHRLRPETIADRITAGGLFHRTGGGRGLQCFAPVPAEGLP